MGMGRERVWLTEKNKSGKGWLGQIDTRPSFITNTDWRSICQTLGYESIRLSPGFDVQIIAQMSIPNDRSSFCTYNMVPCMDFGRLKGHVLTTASSFGNSKGD